MKILMCVTILFLATSALAEKGLYGEMFLGRMDGKFSFTSKGTFAGDQFRESESDSIGSSTVFGFGGGYQFSDYIAIEVAYRDYGDITDRFTNDDGAEIRDTIESTSLNLGAKAMYPVAPSVSLYGRLGLANWDVDVSSTDAEVFSISESGREIYWALGAAYSFNEKMSLGLEYSALTMSWDMDISDADFDIDGSADLDYEVSGFCLVGKMSF